MDPGPLFPLAATLNAPGDHGDSQDPRDAFDNRQHARIVVNLRSDSSPIHVNRSCSTPARPPYSVHCDRAPNALPDLLIVRIVVAITGASGSLYAQRLLENLARSRHEIHLLLSRYAQAVIAEELGGQLRLPDGVQRHSLTSMNLPFASGSNPCDAMVVIPCSMGTLGRIAHGISDDALLRSADVTLKERKKLILVPRETPLSLVHVKNFELLLLAGAIILPANPSFYSRPSTPTDVVDTVVARILDHLGVTHELGGRWKEESE